MIKKARGKKRRRSGAVMVEAAMVLPMVLMFFLGIMEYGRWLMTSHVYNNAACLGAAYASKHGSPIVLGGSTYGCAGSDVINTVNSTLGTTQLTNQTISVYQSDVTGNYLSAWAGQTPGAYVCVQITGTYNFAIFRWLGLPSSISPTFQAVRRSEGN